MGKNFLYFNPKNKEIEEIFNQLTKYPLKHVDSKTAQTISRYKKIRYLNSNRKDPLIYINKGLIGLNPKITIKPSDKGKGFNFNIF